MSRLGWTWFQVFDRLALGVLGLGVTLLALGVYLG